MGDSGYMDAAAVPVPDAGDTLSGIDLTAVKVLIDHQRRDAGSCICGWGVDAGNLGQSHALHVWRELQAAGVTPPVLDAGDDTLRRAIVTTIGNHTVPIKATLPNGEQTWPASIHILIGESEVAELADALLPRIREHVAAAVQVERERVLESAVAMSQAAAARERADGLRELLDSANKTIIRVQQLLHDWDRLGRGRGIHGRQLRAALDGTEATHGTR